MNPTTPNPPLPGTEMEAAKRFFTLRESGWAGWINQDGYKVEDINQWIINHSPTVTLNTKV